MTQAAVLEDDKNDWLLDAHLAIVRLSITEPTFDADALRKVLRPAPHSNLVGLAFTTARKAGLIEPVAVTISTTKSRHHGILRVWRRKQEGVEAA